MWWFALATQLLGTGPPDSLTILRAARAAQAHFERFRVDHLPWSRGGSHWGRCDEVIGRFCFWHDEDESWQPTPEAPIIHQARGRLLATLDSLALLLPADSWITGQRVRYRIEAADYRGALADARACRATPSWCRALEGYALHAARDYRAADSTFGAALEAMPPNQRCAWTDLSEVVGGLRGRYHKLSCAQQAELDRRIWWLADPLYLVPGNERRTEHFSRRVLVALQDQARSPYDVRWGSDLDELVLRYGWPVAWERERPVGSSPGRPGVIGHNDRMSWQFLPPARFVEAPNTIGPDDWDLDPDRPVTSYAPAYASAFVALAHQLAVFRRGDSMVVVAGYDVRPDGHDARPAPTANRVTAALVLARDENAKPVLVRGTGPGPEGVLIAIAPAESTLLSLETLDAADSAHAARVRYLLPVPPRAGGISLSDPLLLRLSREDSLPQSLADAVPLVRGAPRAGRGERVGVFWETYGLEDRAAPFRVTLTVTRRGRSWVRKAAEWAGLVGREGRYVSLAWEEPPRAGTPVFPRALAISLPDASPGAYLLEITVTVPGAHPMGTAREILLQPQ